MKPPPKIGSPIWCLCQIWRARSLKSFHSIESINYQEALFRLFLQIWTAKWIIKILVGKAQAGVQLCAFRMCSNSRHALIYEKLRLRNMEENTNIFYTWSNVFHKKNMEEIGITSSWLILVRNFAFLILHLLSKGKQINLVTSYILQMIKEVQVVDSRIFWSHKRKISTIFDKIYCMIWLTSLELRP